MAGIYMASKAAHGARWRSLRDSGVPICSTWIDESEQGATEDWEALWRRCISEAAYCSALIVYREPQEVLKGAWVEVGAALAAGRPVFAVGIDGFSVRHHPGVTLAPSLEASVEMASRGLPFRDAEASLAEGKWSAARWEHQSGVNLADYEAERDLRRKVEARENNLRERLDRVADLALKIERHIRAGALPLTEGEKK